MLVTSIFLFTHNVFYHVKSKFSFLITYILSSTKALNFSSSKILLLSKESRDLSQASVLYITIMLQVLARKFEQEL